MRIEPACCHLPQLCRARRSQASSTPVRVRSRMSIPSSPAVPTKSAAPPLKRVLGHSKHFRRRLQCHRNAARLVNATRPRAPSSSAPESMTPTARRPLISNRIEEKVHCSVSIPVPHPPTYHVGAAVGHDGEMGTGTPDIALEEAVGRLYFELGTTALMLCHPRRHRYVMNTRPKGVVPMLAASPWTQA